MNDKELEGCSKNTALFIRFVLITLQVIFMFINLFGWVSWPLWLVFLPLIILVVLVIFLLLIIGVFVALSSA